MKPTIHQVEGSKHFDVSYTIRHEDLLSHDGIVSALSDLRQAWQHFLDLRKKHQIDRLPHNFLYYFFDGNNFPNHFYPEATDKMCEKLYENHNAFWKNAAMQRELIPLYKTFFDDLIIHFDDQDVEIWDKSFWGAGYIQVGEVMTFQLAMANPSHISLYSKLLQNWSMHHEVYQLKEIQFITEKHGVIDETLELMRVRCAIDGQHGSEQLLYFLKVAKSELGNLQANPKLVKLIQDSSERLLTSKENEFQIYDSSGALNSDEPLKEEILSILK